MQALIDADFFLYEVGFGSQWKDENNPELMHYKSYEEVGELLKRKIDMITFQTSATEEPILFLTASSEVIEQYNTFHSTDLPMVPNFRESIKMDRIYKGQRKGVPKPFHYGNVISHLISTYDVRVNTLGLEADDMMAIHQTMLNAKGVESVICSRDKDLKQIAGWQYTWECHLQPEWGPFFVEQPGGLELVRNVGKSGKPSKPKLKGWGNKFFYAQMVCGDSVDNIGGLRGFGDVKAYDLLNPLTTERAMYEAVRDLYIKADEDNWQQNMKDMAGLTWMVRELKDGQPVFWRPPNG